jgi:hypothetical protein
VQVEGEAYQWQSRTKKRQRHCDHQTSRAKQDARHLDVRRCENGFYSRFQTRLSVEPAMTYAIATQVFQEETALVMPVLQFQ